MFESKSYSSHLLMQVILLYFIISTLIVIFATTVLLTLFLLVTGYLHVFYVTVTGDQQGHFYDQFRRTQAGGARRADDVS